MGGRFQHSQHVLRVAGVFAAAFVGFILIRAALIPEGFGVYGFYRAGALDDARARPVVYAGAKACVDCHDAVVVERAKGRHQAINCEACHGPLASHAAGNFEVKVVKPEVRPLCVRCHTQITGRPALIPQIVPADHMGDASCEACHKPHRPKIE